MVARLLEQTARAIYDARGPKAVHPGQWAALRYIALAGKSARTVGGVAEYLGVTHAPASRAVAALARKGLVTVKADPQDRRIRRIELTPAGVKLLERDPVQRVMAAIDSLDPARRDAFADTLKELYQKLAGL
ncbi:MAG: MarR family transcriptional regulator [Hyphomonadaceae bacterium]